MSDLVNPPETAGARAEGVAVAAGRLPARYAERWQTPFLERIAALLRPGIRILDVGSGARPAVAPEHRPQGCHYVGLDVSATELTRAGVGAYDHTVVGDICAPLPFSLGHFDLVLSWQVLEHVPSMKSALATQHSALVPGGHMVAMLSGGWAFYSLAARVIPHRVSKALQAVLVGRDPETTFPTHYDGCTDRALRRILRQGGWSSWEVLPLYRAGGYLGFSRPLQSAYLVYENWVERQRHANLATHYLVHAVA